MLYKLMAIHAHIAILSVKLLSQANEMWEPKHEHLFHSFTQRISAPAPGFDPLTVDFMLPILFFFIFRMLWMLSVFPLSVSAPYSNPGLWNTRDTLHKDNRIERSLSILLTFTGSDGQHGSQHSGMVRLWTGSENDKLLNPCRWGSAPFTHYY